ncbi:MAG: hypothetical protein IBX71_06470 [Candidatus Desulforudis sp.]|nr:hypothetical protein [Desulforudis sp.]
MIGPFLANKHKTQYVYLVNQLKGGKDRGYQALSYILAAPGMEGARIIYLTWRRDEEKTWDDLWNAASVLSHGEQLLLRVAVNLYSASGAVDLSAVCGMLDQDNFTIFERALRIYRHGLREAGPQL